MEDFTGLESMLVRRLADLECVGNRRKVVSTDLWLRSPLELSLDGPWQRWLPEFLEDGVGYFRVFVFGVD